MRTLVGCAMLLVLLSAAASGADISGKWKFMIELDPVGYGEPVFVFEQKGCNINGKYYGPLGERTVTGKIDGNNAEFSFVFDRSGKAVTAIYTGTLTAANKMAGKLKFNGFFVTGVWTATRL